MLYPSTAVLTLALVALTGCASELPQERRLLVKLQQPSADGEAIARHAADVARTPVRYIAATSAEWHALTLRCAREQDCDDAMQRLRADTSSYASVSEDGRRRVHKP
jgi:hypothetical protein